VPPRTDLSRILTRSSNTVAAQRYSPSTMLLTQADWPCGQALPRGFEHMLEGQARAKHLTRCPHCRRPATEDAQVSA
jgi:hypothetical protein